MKASKKNMTVKAQVYAICEANPGASRKEMLDLCAKQGISKGSASTFFAAWKRGETVDYARTSTPSSYIPKNRCKCISCGKSFGGITAFDAHRVGEFTMDHPTYGRRCLRDEEISALGYKEVDGVWKIPMPEDVKNKLTKA